MPTAYTDATNGISAGLRREYRRRELRRQDHAKRAVPTQWSGFGITHGSLATSADRSPGSGDAGSCLISRRRRWHATNGSGLAGPEHAVAMPEQQHPDQRAERQDNAERKEKNLD